MLDGERPEQQGRLVAQPDRPVADGADQDAGHSGHEAEFAQWRHAVPVAVGRLGMAVGAEGPVEQRLDLRPIGRAFGVDGEHERSAMRRVGNSPTARSAAISAQPDG